MPVHVQIPTRIKVDPQALFWRREDLAEAFGTALDRALTNAYDTVVEERGGYVGARFQRPRFAWSGGGLERVPEALREEVEQNLTELIQQGLLRSGIVETAMAFEDAPETLPEVGGEVIDPQRINHLMRLYKVPSYDNEGEEQDVPVDTAEDEPLTTAGSGILYRVAWDEFPFETIANDPSFREYMYFEMSKRYGEAPQTPYHGLIWKTPDSLAVFFVERKKDLSKDGTYYTFPLNQFRVYEFLGPDQNPPWRVNYEVPDPDTTRLRLHGPFSSAERLQVATNLWEETIRNMITTHYHKPETMKEDEYQEVVNRAVTAQLEARSRELPDGSFKILELEIGTSKVLINFPSDEDLTGEVFLYPITWNEPYRPGAEGEGEQTGGAGEGEGHGTEGGTGTGGTGGDGQGRGGRRGGFVDFGGDGKDTGEGGAFFPILENAEDGEQSCDPLLGEPPLSELGEDGERLKRLMAEIAFRLQIRQCEHVARFAVNAAFAVGSRAAAVAAYAASNQGEGEAFAQPLDGQGGNMGAINFNAVASPAIQFMRHLAGVVPLISGLSREIMRVYAKAEYRRIIEGTWSDNPAGWNLHFLMAFTPAMKQSVGFHFGMTCQVVLLQLLRYSHRQIETRLTNIDTYAANFEDYLLPQLEKLEDLLSLRERLSNMRDLVRANRSLAESLPSSPVVRGAMAVLPATSWIESTRQVTEAIQASAEVPEGQRGERGQIVVDDQGEVSIWDGNGRLWTMAGLERAIVMRRGLLEEVDPLIKQFAEMDEILERFRDPDEGVRAELRSLLEEMKTNNEEMLEKTENSWLFAVRASRISEHLPAATVPGTSFALQGIHLQAHHQIGEFFMGDGHYALGINGLFNSELGLEALGQFFEFTGILLLSIVCPPAGFVVGLATAGYHYAVAAERERLFGALIDPELVLTRAEVEIEMFAAQLGLALSFIPEAGSVLASGARTGLRLGARGAVQAVRTGAGNLARSGARGVARAIGQRITRSMVQQLKHGLVVAFLREIATDQAMDQIIQRLLAPVIQRMQREIRATGTVGGMAGAQQELMRQQRERRARAQSAPSGDTGAGAGSQTPTVERFERVEGADLGLNPPENKTEPPTNEGEPQ